MRVTVVIPSYNRLNRVVETIQTVLCCDTTGLDEVEVIVVDDGSPVPVESLLAEFSPSPPFTLRCIRQKNAGPCAARNAGFRAAQNDLVICVDDDILCSPDLIKGHVQAHQMAPRSVIFGIYPHLEVTRFLSSLAALDDSGTPQPGAKRELVPVESVASGHISFEKPMFDPGQAIYRDDLTIPVADDWELAFRLRSRGIPIYQAPWIMARHNGKDSVAIRCNQLYRVGAGCAEAAVKCPEILSTEALASIIRINGPISRHDSSKRILIKIIKQVLATAPSRATLLWLVQRLEPLLPPGMLLARAYRGVMGLYLFVGVRKGLHRFTTDMYRSRASHC